MVAQHSFLPYSKAHVVLRDTQHAIPAPHAPRQNHLLAALPEEEYERLLLDLEPVPLPLGWVVYEAGDWQKYLYFPTSGIVSRFYVTNKGASTELTVQGNESVIGIASILGGESEQSQTAVLSAGYAYRLRSDLLKNEFEHDRPLAYLLLRYSQALITQTAQVAVCNRHHSLEQQLCRWILSILDRLDSNELTMTHELIASMLGARRESVTEAIGSLRRAGLIRSSRIRIVVLDRSGLEARTCECYAVVKREHDRLLRVWDV